LFAQPRNYVKKRLVKYLLTVSILLLLALSGFLFLDLKVRRNRPTEIFAYYIAKPIPQSVKILKFEYTPTSLKEWNGFYHIQISPDEFPILMRQRRYGLPGRVTTKEVQDVRGAYRAFSKQLPPLADLADFESYAAIDTSQGVVCDMLVNSNHSELFFMLRRF
jgi:hypothetical protein